MAGYVPNTIPVASDVPSVAAAICHEKTGLNVRNVLIMNATA
jgi:hypothetical protein